MMRLNRVELFYAFLLRFHSEQREDGGSWPPIEATNHNQATCKGRRPRPGPLQGRLATARPLQGRLATAKVPCMGSHLQRQPPTRAVGSPAARPQGVAPAVRPQRVTPRPGWSLTGLAANKGSAHARRWHPPEGSATRGSSRLHRGGGSSAAMARARVRAFF
ncbi:hypothetical protein GW17_00059026 [Ensete ventricosum]|nr:hypothetical protein GW17_00059026 [Ensete ventricosum]